MILEISEQERVWLTRILEHEIRELGPEIRHTQTSSYRDELKENRNALKDLLHRLDSESESASANV